jgi:hypothetical protein
MMAWASRRSRFIEVGEDRVAAVKLALAGGGVLGELPQKIVPMLRGSQHK